MRTPTPDVQHELTFTSAVAGLVTRIAEDLPDLGFARAAIEISRRGTATRRDFTLYDHAGRPALTGELKLPYRPDGRSPYNFAVVKDAADKAVDAGVRYFFTWNVNTFVLWDLQQAGRPLIHRDQEKADVAEVALEEDLYDPDLLRAVGDFWRRFLPRFVELRSGVRPLASRSLDERFIDILDSALNRPAMIIRSAIGFRYREDAAFKRTLNGWMSGHGMRVHSSEMSGNIQRAAKIAAYVLASRLMFYKALHKRFGSDLRRLDIPSAAKTAAQLRTRLDRYFRDAERVTGDYETIFAGDALDDLPFVTDDVVPAWRGLLEDIEGFDFTELDYDLIGPIFEQLISPHERHRWGQHYTKPEVCDIINAFVIKSPSDSVLDPACGGGTFLVRAYARKSYLAERAGEPLSHQELLSQINGIDISPYAAHIATVNLATRRLEDEANYPRVAVHDFFDATPHKALLHLPIAPSGPEERRTRDFPLQPLPNTALGQVRAVIGNPPYIRQEEVGDANKRKFAERAIRSPVPMPNPPGRSDIYIYFWPHAASFLANGGRIAFLTSSNWLDTEYGAALKGWMLANFRIVAVIESSVEPWFTGARVATAITVLERETDETARNENLVKFVQVRAPLAEMLGGSASEHGRLREVERFVQEIVEADADYLTPTYRLRRVPQCDLAIGKEEETACRSSAFFVGPKWGVYLRGPGKLFELLDRYGPALVPLSEVADIKFGVKSGADEFFFVRDVTDERLRDPSLDFWDTYRIRPEQTSEVRVIEAGDKSNHLLEAKYLVPEIHRLAEADSVEIDPSRMPRRMVAISDPVDELPKHAARYVRWGRQKGRQFHKRSTCAARALWYDVTGFDTPTILWSMSHKYRHLAPYNPARVVPNHNLFGVRPREGINDRLLCAILNSTVVGWLKCFVSRPMGTEGFKTEVVDANRLPVPDPRLASPKIEARILDAFDRMRGRKTLYLLDELALKDRQDLDDAVLEIFGYGPHTAVQVRKGIYKETQELYRSLRHVEVQATRNRTRTARRARITPHDVAMEIWDGMDRAWLRRFPTGFIPEEGIIESEQIQLPLRISFVEVGTSLFTVESSRGERVANGGQALAAGDIRIEDEVLRMGLIERAEFLDTLILSGRKGVVEVPLDAEVCRRAVAGFKSYRETLRTRVRELAEEHVGLGRLADQVASELEAVCLQGYGAEALD